MSTESKTYRADTPTIRVSAASKRFRMETPTLRIVTGSDAFRAAMPTLRITVKKESFRAVTHTLRMVMKSDDFRTTMPKLSLFAKTDAFAAITPTLRLVATSEDGETASDEPGAVETGMVCANLSECFPREEILREEANLSHLGYTPENYPTFCQDVAQSLGGCLAQDEGVGPTGVGVGETSMLDSTPTPDGDTLSGLVLGRCLALEEYAIELQRRSDAGEDTDAEGERLMLIVMAASQHLLDGRTDRYCAQITANLP
ncbi:MAG: hypothetical protein AAFY31_01365 [Pseudomonadota bacterium]